MFTFCIVLSLFSAHIVYTKADSPVNQINPAPEQTNNVHSDSHGINFDNVQLFKGNDEIHQSRRLLPQASRFPSNGLNNNKTPSLWLNPKASHNLPNVYHLMIGPNKFKLLNASDVRFISKKPANARPVASSPSPSTVPSTNSGNTMYQTKGNTMRPMCGSLIQYLYSRPLDIKPNGHQNLTTGGNSFAYVNVTQPKEAANKQNSTEAKPYIAVSQTAGNGKVVITNSSSVGQTLGNATGFIIDPNSMQNPFLLINKTMDAAKIAANNQMPKTVTVATLNVPKTNTSAGKSTNTKTNNTATAVKGNGVGFADTGLRNSTSVFVPTPGLNKPEQMSIQNLGLSVQNGTSPKGSGVFVASPQKGANNLNTSASSTTATTNNNIGGVSILNTNNKNNFGSVALAGQASSGFQIPTVPISNTINSQQQNPAKVASAMLNQAVKTTNNNLPTADRPLFINPLTPTRRGFQPPNTESGSPYPISYRMGSDEAFQKPMIRVEQYPSETPIPKEKPDDVLLDLFRNISATNYLNHWVGKKILNETLHHTEQNQQIVDSNCRILDVLLKQSKQ